MLSGADLWREAGGGNAGLLHLSMRIGTPSVLSTWSNLSSGSIGESLTSCCVTTDFFADCCTVRRCSPKIFAVAARARCRSLDSLPEPEEFDLMESALISHAIWARSLALPSPPSPSPSRIAIDPWWVQRMSAQGSKCTESGHDERRARDALLRSSLLRTIACFWRRVGIRLYHVGTKNVFLSQLAGRSTSQRPSHASSVEPESNPHIRSDHTFTRLTTE